MFDARAVRVMLASPSDTGAERAAVAEVVSQWNADYAEEAGVVLLAVAWERDAVSEVGGAPQAAINRQLVNKSDVLIGVFWTRLGTATEKHLSGTVEELERFVEAGKPAALFFSNRPVEPGTVDPDQLKRLQQFKEDMRARALSFEYGELQELRVRVNSFLTATVRERFHGTVEEEVTAPSGPRASIVAQVTSEQRPGSNLSIRDWHLAITNSGAGSARNVTLELEAITRGEEPWELLDADPIDYLAPNGHFRYLLMLHIGSARRCNATVRWLNEDETPGEIRQTLTL